MIAAIIILAAAVLFLAVSLGFCESRRRRAEGAYHSAYGEISVYREQNEKLLEQSGALFEALQQERAAHAATVEHLTKCEDSNDPCEENAHTGQTEPKEANPEYTEMAKQIVMDAISKGIEGPLKEKITEQLDKIQTAKKFDPKGGKKK